MLSIGYFHGFRRIYEHVYVFDVGGNIRPNERNR